MAHAVALSLGTARIADRGERSKQGSKRHHGDFPEVGDVASTDPFLIVPPLTFGHGRLRPPPQNCMALPQHLHEVHGNHGLMLGYEYTDSQEVISLHIVAGVH